MTPNLFTSASDAIAFMLAGRATITLRSKATDARFTYKITASKDGGIHFVSLLTGSDNENSYAYFGYIKRGVFYHGGAKARVGEDASSTKAFVWTWKMLAQTRMPESLEVWHEGKCGRCGRKLTVPTSIANGIGPECATRVGSRFMAEEMV